MLQFMVDYGRLWKYVPVRYPETESGLRIIEKKIPFIVLELLFCVVGCKICDIKI